MPRLPIALALAAIIAAACASGRTTPSATPIGTPVGSLSPSGPTAEILPILVSSEIIKGPNRFLFSLTDRQNKLIAAPDVAVRLRFYDVDTAADTVVFETDSRFLWAIEGRQGLYVADVTFPDAGRWGTEFVATLPGGAVKTVRADYDVAESGSTPAIGEEVPPVDTPTLADVGGDVAQISSDPEPEERLYETSISDALEAGEPFVVVFSTPAFCETRLCGPTLDTVKSVASDFPDVTFINVEPYKMALEGGRLQPELDAQGQLQPAEATTSWGLLSEPYTFVVAGDGTVSAKFEGVLAADELRSAVDGL